MKLTTYKATLSNGVVDSRTTRVPDYTAGVQSVTWQGELRLTSMSRTKEGAFKTAAMLANAGVKEVRVLDLIKVEQT